MALEFDRVVELSAAVNADDFGVTLVPVVQQLGFLYRFVAG
jgi:hypothetical protein